MSGGQTERGKKARLSAITFTLLALVLTVMSAFLLSKLMSRASLDKEAIRPVVVAKVLLNAGAPIKSNNLRVAEYPTSSVPAGHYTKVSDVLAAGVKVPLHTIVAGEPVLKSRLSSPGTGTGIAPLVPSEMRAFPVSVDGWVARSKMVYPGAVVDVLTTIRLSDERKTITKVVLQNLKVLAVDGAVDGIQYGRKDKKKAGNSPGRSRSVVTLLVAPTQVEALALANREGKLDIMLRNAQDDSTFETNGMTASELLGREVETAAEAANRKTGAGSARRPSAVRRSRRGSRRTAPKRRKPASYRSGGTQSIVLP